MMRNMKSVVNAKFFGLLCVGLLLIMSGCKNANKGSEEDVNGLDAETEVEMDEEESLDAQGYVDLGLSSGTLWKSENERNSADAHGFYTYNDAMEMFGNSLPTKRQFEELSRQCTWTWDGNKKGYFVEGPNGNSIFLPAQGDCDCDGELKYEGAYGDYWTSTAGGLNADGSEGSWALDFTFSEVGLYTAKRCGGLSVRLVYTPQCEVPGYVDLGLPSGTLWKTENEVNSDDEDGFFTYQDAVARFGYGIPRKAQMEELRNLCTWTWNDSKQGYDVEGPNGNTIFMPVEGSYEYYYGQRRRESRGGYWVQMTSGLADAWLLEVYAHKAAMTHYNQDNGYSVRLVKDKNEVQDQGNVGSGIYVDLGLPSGTKWRDMNEENSMNDNGFFTFDDAVSAFGSNLPTKEQYVELMRNCSWDWDNNGVYAKGPNGNSVFFPAAGEIACNNNTYYVGTCGFYWSYTPSGSESGWALYFNAKEGDVRELSRCVGMCVRLVQK